MREPRSMPEESAEEIGVLRALLGMQEAGAPTGMGDTLAEPEPEQLPPPPPEPPPIQPVSDLLTDIRSPDDDTRRAALRSLLEREPDMTSAAAAASVLQDPEPDIRSMALQVLEEAPHLVPVDALTQAAHDPEPALRDRALVLLGRTGNPAAVELLDQRVLGEDDDVVASALRGLAELIATAVPLPPDATLIDRVLGTVASLAPARHFRFTEALRRLAAAVPPDEVASRLASRDPRVRVGAALLALEGGSEALLQALAGLAQDEDPDLRRLAMVGLARIGTGPRAESEGAPPGAEAELPPEEPIRPLRAVEDFPPAPPAGGREAGLGAEGEMPDWLPDELEEARPEELAEAARRLADQGRLDLLPAVAEALVAHPDDALRRAGGALGDAAAWGDLLRAWKGHPDPGRRADALRLQAALHPDEEGVLHEGLADPNATVRLTAIRLARHAVDGPLWERLAMLAREDAFPSVRREAAAVFRRARLDRRLAAASGLLDHADAEVRMAAADLLAGGTSDEAVVLSRFLVDPDPRVASRATELLAGQASSDVLAVLWTALRGAPPPTRRRLTELLMAFDHATLARLAGQAAAAPVASERAIGVRVMGALERYGGLERLLGALGDHAAEVRLAALEALEELPSPAAIEALEERLGDPDPDVRLGATRVLARVDDDRAVPPLVRAAGDPSEDVRREARDAVLARRSASVARGLLPALGDPVRRRAAVELLGAMREFSVGFLLEALEEGDREIRFAVGDALRGGEAEEAVIGMLRDPRPDVRRRAVLGVQAMGAPGAVVPLIDRLRDPDPRVRVLAAGALGELGDRRAEEPLKRAFVSDPDVSVVAATERALRHLASEPDPGEG